ncbi:MAG: hypothetical protein GC178_02640 [Flavobacteriales bacterium]|nr:hypothetical protein [Flavobacteriales bacterium]
MRIPIVAPSNTHDTPSIDINAASNANVKPSLAEVALSISSDTQYPADVTRCSTNVALRSANRKCNGDQVERTSAITLNTTAMALNRKHRKPQSKAHSGIIRPEDLDKKGGVIPMTNGHWLRKALTAMKVGETYFVDKRDWNWVGRGNTPARIVTSLNEKKVGKYTIGKAADETGWIIERLE